MHSWRTEVSPEIYFHGRSGDPRLGQWVAPLQQVDSISERSFVLWGCPDDEGVRRNLGRAGAKGGPDSIRKHLYRMTLPMDSQWEDSIQFYDGGNLTPGASILDTQNHCESVVTDLCARGARLIALGGGHDFAAPNFLGFCRGRQNVLKKRLKFGLINVDPHLDVRELENGLPHSGTPFRQILDSSVLDGKNFLEFGTRRNRNARAHYQYCQANGARILQWEELEQSGRISQRFQKELAHLASRCDQLGVTFDMDACRDGEGVSAPPVLGFSAIEMVQMAAIAGAQKKVEYFEVAEVAPNLEPNERSSRIAAEMIFAFLQARAEMPSRGSSSRRTKS